MVNPAKACLFFALLGVLAVPAFAQEKTVTAAERLTAIEDRLKKIEDNQKLILENQEKTYEFLESLRIWIRRT